MPAWKRLTVLESDSLRAVIACIDVSAQKLALVVDSAGRLRGTCSDGDIRRAILRGVSLDVAVYTVMNIDPVVIRPGLNVSDAREQMVARRINLAPIVDSDGRLVGVESLDPAEYTPRPNRVVLMAGGKGLRLRPLTEHIPKPLLRVKGVPLLELMIRQLTLQGFTRFTIAINYLGHMIEEYFGDGRALGVEIEYMREDRFLGTAGALSLLNAVPTEPIVVMNGDVLTKLRVDWLLDFHEAQGFAASVAVREYEFSVPFGVVKVLDGLVDGMDEKPLHRMFVNAGIYVLSPSVLSEVAGGVELDMPTLLERIRRSGRRVGAFPMREAWIDVGRPEDFQRASLEFSSFSDVVVDDLDV